MTTIVIDMGKKCLRCGKPGALKNGLCMACISKLLARGRFDHILRQKQVPTNQEKPDGV